MKPLLLAVTVSTLLFTQAHAADPELSINAKRMLAYGTLAVMTGACKTPLTPVQTAQIRTGMQHASEAQQDLSQDQFTDLMKTVGAQVGQNKEQVCAGLTPDFVATSLEQAAEGN